MDFHIFHITSQDYLKDNFYNYIGMDCGTYKFNRLGCYELKSKKIYMSEENI